VDFERSAQLNNLARKDKVVGDLPTASQIFSITFGEGENAR